jgi:hypothetical protein
VSGSVEIYIGARVNGWDPAGTRMTRTYTVTYWTTDACRNLAETTAMVTVPHDQGVEGD